MVSRSMGLLESLPEPAALPDWLPALDFNRLVQDFRESASRHESSESVRLLGTYPELRSV